MNMLAEKVATVNRRHPKGEVGIEIEVEGKNLPRDMEYWWERVREGSLRDEGYEYVLKKPVTRSSVHKTLSYLSKTFHKNNTEPVWSQRTSVHVHVNVQDMTFYDTIKYAILYYIFEDVLVSNFKKERQGNNFCLRLKDAMAVIDMLKDALETGTVHEISPDIWKYGALNLSTIFKFGSLEFRSMDGNLDEKRINEWVNVVLALKDASLRYETIAEIVEAFSYKGIEGFTKDVFMLKDVGDLSGFVTNKEGWEDSVLNGLWRVQGLAYVKPKKIEDVNPVIAYKMKKVQQPRIALRGFDIAAIQQPRREVEW